ARHRADTVRRRRLALTGAAVALAAAVGVGSWLAASGDETPPPSHKPSAPARP
ncbi:serine/threonine protein kinase, partial [Streptomyces bambusae]|nr:serine/threonine protein kinase [Streptomyces bambusae]